MYGNKNEIRHKAVIQPALDLSGLKSWAQRPECQYGLFVHDTTKYVALQVHHDTIYTPPLLLHRVCSDASSRAAARLYASAASAAPQPGHSLRCLRNLRPAPGVTQPQPQPS